MLGVARVYAGQWGLLYGDVLTTSTALKKAFVDAEGRQMGMQEEGKGKGKSKKSKEIDQAKQGAGAINRREGSAALDVGGFEMVSPCILESLDDFLAQQWIYRA